MSVRLKRTREAYEEFSAQVGMLTRNERTQAYGFSRSVSQKAVWARKNYQKELDKYKEVRYNKDGTVVVTDDMTAKKHYSPPDNFKSNAVVDYISGKKHQQTNRAFYDQDGKMIKQIDGGNHGRPKSHPFGKNGEHAHDITYPNGEFYRGDGRELTDEERLINGDFL
jgi:hypothetical protein